MRSVGSVGLNTVLGLARGLGAGALGSAIAIALIGSSVPGDAYAQYRSTTQVQSTQRYVSSTKRRVAVPVRNQRVYAPPRGARLLSSRYWDPRTRWIVDSRTHSTYAVLRNGEVWFLEPSSGWAYTVDRYGRVYGADPRRNSIYAFSSLHSWRGDLFYFFDFFSPYDGYYTVRDYDWFYSSYYGRRAPLYDYGYAYRTMWDDFDDFWFSNRFYRSISFRYYQPNYIRYGSGWNSRYYYDALPSVYIAPCYSYTVVNNTVVVNNNYYTVNNITNTGGRGLPTAEQAALQLSQQVSAPTMGTSNQISAQQLSLAGIQTQPEMVKEVSIEAAAPIIAAEPAVEVPGMVVSEPLPTVDPSALSAKEPAFETPQEPVTQPSNTGTEKEPVVGTTPQQPVVEPTSLATEKQPVSETTPQAPVVEPSYSGSEKEPVNQEPAVEPSYSETQKEPAYQEPAYQEPTSQQEKEPVYQEPAYQEPTYQEPTQEPAYEQPNYSESQKEPAYEEPTYQEPAYQEPAYEQPSSSESAREPAYEAPQESYEAPQESYEAPQESYEAPQESYEAPQESYEAPQESYEAPQESYEAPQESYEAPQESYEAPQERYEAPQESYEAPQERYEAPQESYEAPQERYEAPQESYEAPQEAPQESSRSSDQPQ